MTGSTSILGHQVRTLHQDDGGPRALEVCSVSAPKRKKPPTLEKTDDAVEGQKEKKPKKDRTGQSEGFLPWKARDLSYVKYKGEFIGSMTFLLCLCAIQSNSCCNLCGFG